MVAILEHWEMLAGVRWQDMSWPRDLTEADTTIAMISAQRSAVYAEYVFTGYSYDAGDIGSAANWGLLQALLTYVPGLGKPWPYWIQMKVQSAVMNYVRGENTRRRAISSITLDAYDPDTPNPTMEPKWDGFDAQIEARDNLRRLLRALRSEPPQVKEAVLRSDSDTAIARKYNVTTESIWGYRHRFNQRFLNGSERTQLNTTTIYARITDYLLDHPASTIQEMVDAGIAARSTANTTLKRMLKRGEVLQGAEARGTTRPTTAVYTLVASPAD